MFRPSLHGWPFRDTYTCSGHELGLSGAPPEELGLGGGMCWSALDRYLRGAEIPQDVAAPEAGDPLHAELVQRQIAALGGVWGTVRQWQALPDGSWRDRLPIPIPLPGDDVASRTRSAWRTVRRKLKSDEPVLLTLLLYDDGYHQPRAARQVLATGWEKSGARVALSIYDPNRPGDDDARVAFSTAGQLDALIVGGNRIRGFFPVEYDREPPRTVREEAFDDRAVIGLNRTIRGVPAPTSGRKRLDIVARNRQGALLHFWRKRGKHWESVNVSEAGKFSTEELHSDPQVLRRGRILHVFARDYVGDLLHFRRGRSWSVENRTDHKRVGARFRLAGHPVPVAGPRFELSVLGRDANGGLVHYFTRPFRGWRAEQVPGDPVSGDPIAERHDDILHVVGVARDGRVLHWERTDTWAVTDSDAGPDPEVRVTGSPDMMLRDGRVHVFARGRDDHLVVMVLGDDGMWQRSLVAEGLTGDPVATDGPAGLHVFAPSASGGMIHAWRDDDGWDVEDIVETRPALRTDNDTGTPELMAWGQHDEIRVFARRGRNVRVLTWTPDGDWVADTVSDRVHEPPTFCHDDQGRPHLFSAHNGTVVHVETGAWQEPHARKARPKASTRRVVATGTPATEAPPEEAVEGMEVLPTLDDEPVEEVEPDDVDMAMDDVAVEVVDDEDDDEDDGPVLDFDAERRMAPAAPADDDELDIDEAEEADEIEALDEVEDIDFAPEELGMVDASDEPTVEVDEPDEAEEAEETEDIEVVYEEDTEDEEIEAEEDDVEVDEVEVIAEDEIEAEEAEVEAEAEEDEDVEVEEVEVIAEADEKDVEEDEEEEDEWEPSVALADDGDAEAVAEPEDDGAGAGAEPTEDQDEEWEPHLALAEDGDDDGDDDDDDDDGSSKEPAEASDPEPEPAKSSSDADEEDDHPGFPRVPGLPELGDPDRDDPEARDSRPRPRRKFRWDDDQAPPIKPGDIEPMDLSLLDTWPGPGSGQGSS